MERSLSERRLCCVAGRPPGAQRRDRRHRGRLLPAQGSLRPHRGPGTQAPQRQVMSTMPDHLRPITIEIPVTWTPSRRSSFGRRSTRCARKSGPVTADNCKNCLPSSGATQLSMIMTSVLGISSNRLIVQRLSHRPQRPSCCSIETAIPPPRPAPAHAVARSGGPGCPQGIAVGDASRPGRPRARRHSRRRYGRLCPIPDPPRPTTAGSISAV